MDVKSFRLLGNGFRILPVKFEKESHVVRHMFYKQNHVRDALNDTPNDRTLFVCNIPPYCTKECLKRLFETFGPVERVVVQGEDDNDVSLVFTKPVKNMPFQVAHIVFEDKAHLNLAMNKDILKPLLLSEPGAYLVVGTHKWAMEYNNSIPKMKEMRIRIDEYMESYDRKKVAESEKEKEEAGLPDADGFVKVTRRSKHVGISRTKAKEQKILTRENKKNSQKELQNFYSFQIRQSKMEHIAQLREKFESDKKRIAMMKASRRFKPY